MTQDLKTYDVYKKRVGFDREWLWVGLVTAEKQLQAEHKAYKIYGEKGDKLRVYETGIDVYK